MKGFRKTVCMLLFGLVGLGVAGATVSDVTARQRYPWNGKIDIDYTVTGTDTADTALAVSLTDHDTGKVYSLTENGRHQFTWSRSGLVASNVTAMVSLVSYNIPTEGLYCVIDLSEGPNAIQWPVSYLSAVPWNGWTDEYTTTKLVLRRIPAGTFIMGFDQTNETHRVTLTKPFYMGVFEVTQKQWELVMNSWPRNIFPSLYWGLGDTHPSYGVSYDDIRGGALGAKWPASTAVDASSFLGKLRAKTGLDFDLPTEAQWEYACRARTTTKYYWGDSIWGAKDYAWYDRNSYSKTHPVGTKKPNACGLYDMAGNVWEWCRDWSGVWNWGGVWSENTGADPVGAASGSYRVLRGGSWDDYADYCASSYRNDDYPAQRYGCIGFRLVMDLPD